MTKLTKADAVCSLVVHNRTINYRLSVQVLSTAPVVYNSMGAAATPALAYEKHVRSMLCRILVLYWPSNTVAELAAADLLGLGLIRRRSLWLPPQGLLL
jgi:hypothetical protein